MIAAKGPLRFVCRLFDKTACCARHASTSTSASQRTAAPATRLTESYLHCAGTTPLVHHTVGDVIDRAASDYGGNEALVFIHQDIRRSWAEVKHEAERLALRFMSLGLEHGDRIGVWGTNLYEWQLTQYAAVKAGLGLVNVNQAYQVNELEYCLKKVGVKTLVAADGFKTSDYYDMLTQLLPELTSAGEVNVPLTLRSERLPELRNVIMISQQRRRGVLRFDDLLDSETDLSLGDLHRRQAQINSDDHCSIQFTSGTTGLPKGATLSHHNVVNNSLQVAVRLGYDSGSARICMSVPLYHCFGCILGSVLAPLHGNAMVFPSQVFNAEASLKATQDERCTHMYGTPTMFVDMVTVAQRKPKSYDISSLRSGIVAGAPVPFSLMQAMVTDLNMRDSAVGYGQTEASPILTLGFPSDDLEHRCGTVGYPLGHTELKVTDDWGRTVPVGQPGMLCSRGYCNFLGYWGDEDKTAETVTPQRWLITGDVAVMNEDGYVRIVGRAKDLVIRGGENIYPTEVEDFLITHPDVLDVSVFGVPDDRMGEELAVWIRASRPGAVSEHDIRNYCKGKIAHYKIPRYIQFRDEFPKTVTGKIQKFVMRDIMTQELGLVRE